MRMNWPWTWIGTDVDRSALSEDGLYNLMEDLDDLMHMQD